MQDTELDRRRCPDLITNNPDWESLLITNDPDWETFEEIETYASRGRTGFLAHLLPDRAWDYCFAPTVATPKNLKSDHTNVKDYYRAVINVAEDISSQQPVNELWTTDQINNLDQRRFPASVKSLDRYDSFAAYLNGVATALNKERAIAETSAQLLNQPAVAFLRKAERDQIEEIETLLELSIEHGRSRRHAIARERRETVTTLDDQLSELTADLDQLAAQARPYLDLEIYLETDDALDALKSIEASISNLRETHRVELLSHSVVDQTEQIKSRIVSLRDDLIASRKEYTELQLEQLQQTVETGIDDLQERLKPAREDGKIIQSPSEVISQVEDLRSAIEEFRGEPWRPKLTPADLSDLAKYNSRLDNIEQFVNKKHRFDTQYETHAGQFRELRADAAPYLNFEQYLTRSTRRHLVARIKSLSRTVEKFIEGTQFNCLSQADQARGTDLRETIAAIETHLDGYNSTFVRRQREVCAEFFSDIGPANLDLTAEQQRAVIRNGMYNQVIAAAGTGKTLTLTTRVAYLVRFQDVPPDQILVVTYTNNATKEMKNRLANQFGITDVEVRTINSFGNKLLNAVNDDCVETIDSKEKQHVIDETIQSAREAEDSEFLEHYYQFLVHFENQYIDDVDFEAKEDYFEARRDTDYVTLESTRVKSRAEKMIADFLYTHRVDYRYEARATWADTAADKAGYMPDFYLPKHDVYIEHWGIDETASVAPWFSQSSQEYRDKMRWARQQFETTESELIGTYQFEYNTGQFKRALRHRLEHHGVELDRMSFDELVETVFEYNRKEGWIKNQFKAFVENAKQFDVTIEEIESELASTNPRQYHFGQCGLRIHQRYSDYLMRNNLIDFTDQINDACALIKNEPEQYRDQYDHLLVDEFQDIGTGKVELIQSLTGPDGAKLFAVGDDWQSIFSFQGAAVDYFTCFENYFGHPIRTDLTANFRSPPSIVETGNHLIGHNSEQLKKTVRATIDVETTPQLHTLRGYQDNFHDYVRRVRRYTTGLVEEYLADGADPSDIMILCRYDGGASYLDEIKSELQSQEIPYTGKEDGDHYRGPNGQQDGIPVYSIHQAKGREADHVILAHVADGSLGFPANDNGNELLQPVQPLELGGLEEERRLFYVAVTRAERSLDLLTRGDKESQFLDEISDHTTRVDTGQVQPLDETGSQMSVEVQVRELSDPRPKQRQRGELVDKYGGAAKFKSWMSDVPPTVEHGEWYWVENALVDKYNGQKALIITNTTTVERLPEGPTDPKAATTDVLDYSA